MKKYLGYITIGIISAITTIGASKFIESKNNTSKLDVKEITENKKIHQVNTSAMPPADMDFMATAKTAVDAVVHVKKQYGQPQNFYELMFGSPSSYTQKVLPVGSGVIISSDGYIVTNNHVIEQTDYIEVVLNDGNSYPAKLIGTDLQTDIALLKIDAENLPFIPMGNSDDIELGQWVLAIGNPFNLTSTVTAGIISAKARRMGMNNRSVDSFIQTDAVVNPGNSGGALINIKGELIGINTLIYSGTGSFIGYSFAVPVNLVKKVVKDLTEYGKVQRGYLGISIADVNEKIAKELNLNNNDGVLITEITKDYAADKAGLQVKDVVVKIEDTKTKNISALQEKVAEYRPGDKIKFYVMRDGKEEEIEVTLTNADGEFKFTKVESIDALGAKFEKVSNATQEKLNIKGGVLVKSISTGKFRLEGVKEGFIILTVNKTPVSSTDDIKKELDKADGGILIEGIYPNGKKAYYAIGLN